MSKRIQRIEKIVEIAEMEMERAAKTMAYMRGKLQEDQSQLNSLKNYQQDYNKKPAQSGVIDPIQLQTHNAFADKLIHALTAQQSQVEESEKMLEMAENEWKEKRVRVKALMAMHTRLQASEQARLNKQEQKLLDELAAQKFVRG